jgi:transcription initiation factor IIF auxiliary subunit
MCFKKWFGKEEVVEESIPVEAPVERKSVDELLESIQELVVQLNLVVAENKQLEERIKQLEEAHEEELFKLEEDLCREIKQIERERDAEMEATHIAKDQIIDLLNEKAELERRLKDIQDLSSLH